MSTNRKSIQILRSGLTYDPTVSTEILEDGQPYVSHKTNKIYVGDGQTQLKDLDGAFLGDQITGLNLSKGTGANSIIQHADPDTDCLFACSTGDPDGVSFYTYYIMNSSDDAYSRDKLEIATYGYDTTFNTITPVNYASDSGMLSTSSNTTIHRCLQPIKSDSGRVEIDVAPVIANEEDRQVDNSLPTITTYEIDLGDCAIPETLTTVSSATIGGVNVSIRRDTTNKNKFHVATNDIYKKVWGNSTLKLVMAGASTDLISSATFSVPVYVFFGITKATLMSKNYTSNYYDPENGWCRYCTIETINSSTTLAHGEFRIMNDLDFGGNSHPFCGGYSGGWQAEFQGTLDGQYHTLSNMVVATTNSGIVASLGYNGVIKNMVLSNVQITTHLTGAVCTTSQGIIENLYIEGSFTSNTTFQAWAPPAMIVSKNAYGIIRNCIAIITTQNVSDMNSCISALGRTSKLNPDAFTNCICVSLGLNPILGVSYAHGSTANPNGSIKEQFAQMARTLSTYDFTSMKALFDWIDNSSDSDFVKNSPMYLAIGDLTSRFMKPSMPSSHVQNGAVSINVDNRFVKSVRFYCLDRSATNNVANSTNSAVFGDGNVANTANECVVGQFNDTSINNTVFSVGDGTSVLDRKTALYVSGNGDVCINTKSSAPQSLVTREYVDNQLYRHKVNVKWNTTVASVVYAGNFTTLVTCKGKQPIKSIVDLIDRTGVDNTTTLFGMGETDNGQIGVATLSLKYLISYTNSGCAVEFKYVMAISNSNVVAQSPTRITPDAFTITDTVTEV